MSHLACQAFSLSQGPRAEESLLRPQHGPMERGDLALRFGLAGFFWLNSMAVSLALRAGFLEHFPDLRPYVPFALLALTTPVVIYCGYPIHRASWVGLRNRSLRIESLLCLGVLSAYSFSILEAIREASPLCFDTAGAIVTCALAGQLIEQNAKAKASRWVTLLRQRASTEAHLLVESHERVVPIDTVNAGQLLVVKPGERFPTDGRVEEGNSRADESLMMGEPVPISKHEGDTVIAGSMNLDGVLYVRATHAGAESRLARTLTAVETALRNRSPLERRVDRITGTLVAGVAAVAVLTFAMCWVGGLTTAAAAHLRAISVLLIGCPWALRMATPLALTAALGAALRSGVLITGSRILETLARVNHIVLDKTGTITEGRFDLLGCEMTAGFRNLPAWIEANAVNSDLDPVPSDFPLNLFSTSYEQAFELLASLEQYSEHPLGNALVGFARERGIPVSDAACVEIHKGLGVTGIVAGRSMFVGGRRLAESMSILIDARTELVARRWESEGRTVTFFGWDGALRGCLAFGDAPRRNASSVVAELKRRGITPQLVSADSQATTEAIARQLGIESYYAEALPEHKAALIHQERRRGVVTAMVGDGHSDGPALAEANLGIAVGDTDTAAKDASVFLLDSDLQKIPQILDLARKATRIVRQNIFWALFCNMLGIAMAVAGILSPVVAAGVMVLSGACVAGNSLRLGRPASPRS